MGHTAGKDVYQHLKHQLDRMPVGAPGKTTIYEILKILFTREEAEIAASMPLSLSSLSKIARRLDMPASSLRTHLESMADKGLILDLT